MTGVDIDRSHEIYHDDVIVEFPQSGDESLVNTTYTNSGNITLLNLVLNPADAWRSFWKTEYIITYDGRPVNVVCHGVQKTIRSCMKHSTLEIHSNHLSRDLSGSRELNEQISSLQLDHILPLAESSAEDVNAIFLPKKCSVNVVECG